MLRRNAASASRPLSINDGGAGAARQRFEAEGAGAGEGVEHRTIGERQAGGRETAMREDVEQRLAGAVAGRPYRIAGRHGKPTPAMDAADDAQLAGAQLAAALDQKNAYQVPSSAHSHIVSEVVMRHIANALYKGLWISD